VDAVRSNKNTLITIALPDGPVTAYMIDETFSITGSNNWESPFDIEEQLSGRAATSVKVTKRVLGLGKHQSASVLSWVGSQKPDFKLGMVFTAIRESEDPRIQVNKLMRAVYPTGSAGFMKAPLGYKLVKSKGTGLFAVSIGSWFKALSMVMLSVEFNLSKETIETGVPLYAEGSITFTPYQAIYANDMAEYFPGAE